MAQLYFDDDEAREDFIQEHWGHEWLIGWCSECEEPFSTLDERQVRVRLCPNHDDAVDDELG